MYCRGSPTIRRSTARSTASALSGGIARSENELAQKQLFRASVHFVVVRHKSGVRIRLPHKNDTVTESARPLVLKVERYRDIRLSPSHLPMMIAAGSEYAG